MRIALYALFLGIFLPGFVVAGSASQVPLKIAKAYIPTGFDDNDQSQLVVTGILPDTCYQLGPSGVKLDAQSKTFVLTQTSYVHEGPCRDVIIPYTQVFDLGILDAGTYRIVDSARNKELGKLEVVKAAKSSSDDFLYLPLTDVNLRKTGEGKFELSLEAKLTNRCTRFKEAIVRYVDDVIVVQPVATHETAGVRCGTEFRRFQMSVKLKDGLTGTKLLHVRTMDGKALNKVVDLE